MHSAPLAHHLPAGCCMYLAMSRRFTSPSASTSAGSSLSSSAMRRDSADVSEMNGLHTVTIITKRMRCQKICQRHSIHTPYRGERAPKMNVKVRLTLSEACRSQHLHCTAQGRRCVIGHSCQNKGSQPRPCPLMRADALAHALNAQDTFEQQPAPLWPRTIHAPDDEKGVGEQIEQCDHQQDDVQ